MTRFLATIFGSLLATSHAYADWELNMPVGVTDLSAEIYDLHMMVLGVCTIAAVLTFGAMIYALANFRKSKGAEAETWSHNTKAEIIWTVVPTLVLIAMAVPAAQTLVKIEDTRGSEMTVKITGYQWKWHYEYIGEDVGFLQQSRGIEQRRAPPGIRRGRIRSRQLPARRRPAAGRARQHAHPLSDYR